MGYKIIEAPVEAEIEVKRSRFIAAIGRAGTEELSRAFLDKVRKKHRDARHNCFAFRIGMGERILERFSDDGEPQGTAGKPMLDILRGNELTDVICVVTRYFGGTLLGTGGLVMAYSDALKEAIEAAELCELKNGLLFDIACPYELLSNVKYTAQKSGIYIASEEYAEQCRISFISEEQSFGSFEAGLERMSLGKLRADNVRRVLCYGNEAPKVYKEL